MEEAHHIGEILNDKYQLIRVVGAGGMGEVYEGQRLGTDQRVAVKVLHSALAADERILKRFAREHETTAAIVHPNIIELLDVGTAPWGDPYMVMEYLEGESLEQMLTRLHVLSFEAACGILEQILQALSQVHSQGIVHRDLKPDNVFIIRDGEGKPAVKLIDFGISKQAALETQKLTKLTADGALLGTPSYMSPEQARGKGEVDARSDLFAVGVMLYEMLAGSLPFQGAHYNAVLINLLTEDPTPPLDVNPDFPLQAIPIVLKSLEKEPAERYDSATAFLDALRITKSWPLREAGFAKVARSIHHMTTATGSLGGPTLAFQPTRVGTPAKTVVVSRPVSPLSRRSSIPALLLLLALLGLIGTVGYLQLRPQFENAETVSLQDNREEVLITVLGLPSEAKLYLDDVEVADNPFRIEKRDTLARLRVKAPDHKDFLLSFTPDADREIVAEMKKLEKKYNRYKVLTPGLISQVYGKNRAQIHDCHRTHAASESVSGAMTLEILPEGGVKSVKFSGDIPAAMETCIREKTSNWQFPKSNSGAVHKFPVYYIP